MNKFLHGMMQRTCGRDTSDPLNGNDITLTYLSDKLGVEMVAVCDNRTQRARCAVLFGRERSEAANDASYGS
jgi:hypothetical protein